MQHYLILALASFFATMVLGNEATVTVPAASPSTPSSSNTLAPKENKEEKKDEKKDDKPVFSEDDFKKAVNALGRKEAESKAGDFVKSLKDAKIASKKEAAMYLAQLWFLSDKLQAKEEYACKDSDETKKKCDKAYPHTPGKGVKGKHYYGRGYIQLANDFNYANASMALFGDEKKLLEDPDLVAKDESVAWRTAAWYWSAHVHDEPGVKEGKFGATTKAVGGPALCKNPEGPVLQKLVERFKFYETIMKAVGESGKLDESGCYLYVPLL